MISSTNVVGHPANVFARDMWNLPAFLLLPIVGARCLGMRYGEFFRPLWRPTLATALASPVPVFLPQELAAHGMSSRLLALLLTGVCFAALYGVLASWLVLTGPERARFLWGPLRRLSRRGAGANLGAGD